MHAGHALRQADHALQLAHGDPPGRFGDAGAIPLSQALVLLHDKILRLFRDLIKKLKEAVFAFNAVTLFQQ